MNYSKETISKSPLSPVGDSKSNTFLYLVIMSSASEAELSLMMDNTKPQNVQYKPSFPEGSSLNSNSRYPHLGHSDVILSGFIVYCAKVTIINKFQVQKLYPIWIKMWK